MRTGKEVLDLLRGWGATRLKRVALRDNRSTIWSLTAEGRSLNLHVAFADAPLPILRHFATIAREGHRNSVAYREAANAVREWPPVLAAMRGNRARRIRHGRVARGEGPCCATPAQRVYLQRLYAYLNETRFDGLLPSRIYLRLSNRMTSRLGQMVPGMRGGRRAIVEIALNVDLMLAGNGRIRLDTMVHEMAHAADYLFEGNVGHGPTWRDWAEYAGCEPAACTTRRIRRRRRGAPAVDRVPRLPAAAVRTSAA